MLFNSQNIHRRKSSLVSSQPPQRPLSRRGKTSCFVHSLLEEQQYNGAVTPNFSGIEQNRKADKEPPGTPEPGTPEPGTQSRLLTKKQLSDMAYGIRELAKRLAHLRLKLHVQNVFVLTKAHDESVIRYTRELAQWLLQKDDYTV